MVPAPHASTAPVPRPSYQRALAKRASALRKAALTLVAIPSTCRPTRRGASAKRAQSASRTPPADAGRQDAPAPKACRPANANLSAAT
jgi:hypothetical protein